MANYGFPFINSFTNCPIWLCVSAFRTLVIHR